MTPRRLLVGVSAAQLATAVTGLAVALRRGRSWDIRQPWLPWALLHGAPGHIRRDWLWSGTAYSAPAWVLAGQLWAIRNLATGPDDGARRMLGMLGVLMAPGYLAERYVRAHLRPGGWDPVETPVVVTLIGLSAAMGVLGHRAQAGR
jgi:hypothetical protein